MHFDKRELKKLRSDFARNHPRKDFSAACEAEHLQSGFM